jgi:hypothetical protein
MPKAAVYKHNCPILFENNIRVAGKRTNVHSEPKALAVQERAHDLLRKGITPPKPKLNAADSGSGIACDAPGLRAMPYSSKFFNQTGFCLKTYRVLEVTRVSLPFKRVSEISGLAVDADWSTTSTGVYLLPPILVSRRNEGVSS